MTNTKDTEKMQAFSSLHCNKWCSEAVFLVPLTEWLRPSIGRGEEQYQAKKSAKRWEEVQSVPALI